MGRGIAQVAAQAGFNTILYELNEIALAKARVSIEKNLMTLVEKGKIDEPEKEKTIQTVQFTGDIHSCRCDVFIEAIIEKPEAKKALFNQLADLNHSNAIFT